MKRINPGKILVFAIFIVAPFILFWQGFKPHMMLAGYDTVTLGMPFRIFAREMIFKYRDLPVWFPNIMMGVPLIKIANLIFFYPPNLLLMLLPIPVNMDDTLLVIMHMLLGGAGLYLFSRKMGCSRAASCFGGFAYMMCPAIFTLVTAGHLGVLQAAAYIPFVFYFVKRGVDEGKALHFFNAGFCLAMQVLCLMFQLAVYTAAAAAIYMIYEISLRHEPTPKKFYNCMLYMAAIAGMTFLLGALQTMPTLDYMKYSWRSHMTYKQFTERSFLPLETLSFILPGFSLLAADNAIDFVGIARAVQYCGLLPVLLLPYAFIGMKHRKTAIFFSVTALIFLVLAFGGYTPVYRLFYYLPVFKGFRHAERFLFIVNFIIAVLAAMSLDNIFQHVNEGKSSRLLIIISGIPVLTGIAGLISGVPAIIPAWFKSYYASKQICNSLSCLAGVMKIYRGDFLFFTAMALFAALGILAPAKFKIKNFIPVLAAFMLVHFCDARWHSLQYINFQNYSRFFNYEREAADFIKRDKALFRINSMNRSDFPNANLYFGLEEIAGYDGTAPYKLDNLAETGVLDDLKVNRLYNVKYYISKNELPYLKKIYDKDVKIYEDEKAMPRFYVADKLIRVATENEALYLISKNMFDLNKVIVTDDIILKKDSLPLKYKVEILDYTPDDIKVRVAVNKESMLQQSSTYDENWAVKIDGKPGKIYNVNYITSGIVLEKGEHVVEFYYKKDDIINGLMLTLAGILIYALVFMVVKRRNAAAAV